MEEENYNDVISSSAWLRKVPANERGRDYVVGDIHGCLDELISLLAHARFNPKRDHLFSVGDLIDRGPKSAEALDLLEKPWFFAVRGNHEQMLIDHWSSPASNPAYDTSWLDHVHADSIAYYKSLLDSLPHVLKIGQAPNAFYIMHAELWDQTTLITEKMIDNFAFINSRQALAKVLWSRHIITNHWREPGRLFQDESISRIFCGHTIVQTPTAIEQSIYIDTGAFAPYIDPQNAQAEHYGLSLIDATSLRHWFAPTCNHYRGTIVDMGHIETNPSPQNLHVNDMQPEAPDSSIK